MANGGGDGRKDGWTDVWKFPPVFYRTSALWGHCPVRTPLLHWITPSRASGTTDHVRSLDDKLLLRSKKKSVEIKKILLFSVLKRQKNNTLMYSN